MLSARYLGAYIYFPDQCHMQFLNTPPPKKKKLEIVCSGCNFAEKIISSRYLVMENDTDFLPVILSSSRALFINYVLTGKECGKKEVNIKLSKIKSKKIKIPPLRSLCFLLHNIEKHLKTRLKWCQMQGKLTKENWRAPSDRMSPRSRNVAVLMQIHGHK